MAEIVKDLDFWRMAAMGQFIKTVLWGRKESAMYSYNGTVLPKLPEAVSKYPCAVIYKTVTGAYYLATSNGVPTFGTNVLKMNGAGIHYKVDGDLWVEYINHEDDGGYNVSGIFASTIIWANVNVVNESTGAIVESASDPIPVYE